MKITPEDRAEWFAQQRQERYEWAKSVDPDSVVAYEKNVQARIDASRKRMSVK